MRITNRGFESLACMCSAAGREAPPRSEGLVYKAQLAGITSFSVTVTYSIESFDHIEGIFDLFELLSQSLDVAVDSAVVDVNLVVVGSVHQRVATLDHAGAGDERLKDQEFRNRQRDWLVL